jgi:pimeloyl-ACP methyl ester carboxylesterase
LVVHGTADEAVPFPQATSLAARIPGARLLTIEGGRHVSIFTHRDLIQPEVRRFLEEHGGAAG